MQEGKLCFIIFPFEKICVYFSNVFENLPIQRIYLFSRYAKFSEKLVFQLVRNTKN